MPRRGYIDVTFSALRTIAIVVREDAEDRTKVQRAPMIDYWDGPDAEVILYLVHQFEYHSRQLFFARHGSSWTAGRLRLETYLTMPAFNVG
jgi:hypothetical protein